MAEVVKMKQGMSYSSKEKTIILNVFKYFRLNNPDLCVTEVVRRTAKATGCSEKSVFQFRKEEASPHGFKEPSKTKIRKNININSREVKYGHHIRESIRNIIYDLKYQNVVPSLNTILKSVNADTQLPNFSLMTLRRLMFDMGFYYEKSGNKAVLTEKPSLKKENNNPQSSSHNIKQKKCAKNSNNTYVNGNVYKQDAAHSSQALPVNSGQLDYHQNISSITTAQITTNGCMGSTVSAPVSHGMPMMLGYRRDLLPVPHHSFMSSNSNGSFVKDNVTNWTHHRVMNHPHL